MPNSKTDSYLNALCQAVRSFESESDIRQLVMEKSTADKAAAAGYAISEITMEQALENDVLAYTDECVYSVAYSESIDYSDGDYSYEGFCIMCVTRNPVGDIVSCLSYM